MKEPDFQVEMDEYLPLRDVVFQTLRQAILKGELKPGERLMEIQLAKKLGVSRTPVREAIHKLSEEGLVLMTPRKGAEVADISEKSLLDVLEIRKALEDLAVQLACDKITEQEMQDLEDAGENFKRSLKSEDLMEIAEADVAFHDVIYHATDNQKLIQLLNNLSEQMYRYRVEYLKDASVFPRLCKEHDEIVKLVEQRDQKKASQAICEHIDNQIVTVLQSIRNKRGEQETA